MLCPFGAKKGSVKTKLAVAVIVLLAVTSVGCTPTVTIGAKSFTESVVLGQMVVLIARDQELDADISELHGTRLAWSALQSGEIDLYPEYTGTICQEIFSGESLPDDDAIRARLRELGIEMTAPLGFNNSYALGMKESAAEQLGIEAISDLRQHPELKFGFSNEFLDRGDGWPSLRARYELTADRVTGLEHGLAYRAVDVGDIDVTDLYSTDPNIKQYGFRVLADDLGHFPRYNAVYLYRQDLAERYPNLVQSLHRLEGRIDEARMQFLNERVELNHLSTGRVAADFLAEELGVEVEVVEQSLASRVLQRTIEHLFLVAMALAASISISIPLGILAAKNALAGQLILGTVEIIQTVPGLALLVFIGAIFLSAGLPMIGAMPVIAALFLYSLLPIIRNTAAGLGSVSQGLTESATALGLPWLTRLRLVELPLASPTIFAGIKTAAVISVGYAALGGLIGAGGYGQPIMTGLRLNDLPLMLEGAIPAAFLALAVKGVFEVCERRLVPLGLRRG
jgi:osmoprotectant transport system permease protein